MVAAAPRPAAPAAAPKAAAPAAAAPAAAPKAAAPAAAAPAPAAVEGGTPLLAPMPGMIVKNLVNVGDAVKAGDPILVLEVHEDGEQSRFSVRWYCEGA
jgi:Biotin carboxyl carrier protein